MKLALGIDRSTPLPNGLLELNRRRVFILPTRAGLLFAVTLMVMLLGAINYDNSLAHALTFLVTSLLMVAILHTWRNLAGITISITSAEPVFAGEQARFPLTIDNRGGQARHALQFQQAGARRFQSVDVAADCLQSLELRIPTTTRGRLALGRVRSSTSYPLGLFRAWSNYRSDRHCIVYPRPAGQLPLPPPSLHHAQDQSGQQGGAEDFIGFRSYHPGDSIRSIAWKAVARGQEILVKRFSGSGAQQLLLRWQDTEICADTEARLSQLCRWTLEAERLGLRYGLELPDRIIELGSGPEHRQACLLALALFGK